MRAATEDMVFAKEPGDVWPQLVPAPAVVLQEVSGLILSNLYGWPLLSSWSVAVWSLFLLVGACWLPVVAIQKRLQREAAGVTSPSELSASFHRMFRLWFTLGIPAFTAVIVIF